MFARGLASVSVALALAASSSALASPRLETIYAFSKSDPAGYYLGGALLKDGSRNLYSTTVRGGGKGGGTIFQLSPLGHLKVLYRLDIKQIGGPIASVIDPEGNLYGGNTANQDCTIFKLAPDGTFTTVYDFHQSRIHVTSLFEEADRSFVGATESFGGAPSTLFRLKSDGQLITLLSRVDIAPSDLVEDDSGNIFAADATDSVNFQGDVFEYSFTGQFSLLHRFAGPPKDGTFPSSIALDTSGNLIGVTSSGGKNGAKRRVRGYGSVYGLTLQGAELFDLPMKKDTGRFPSDKLVPDGRGNYLSVAGHGSRNAPCGAIFKLTDTGHLESVYIFQGHADGCLPNSNLVSDGKGGFYGTTFGNAALGTYGTIYHLTL